MRGVARTAPSQLRIVTIRHGLKVFVIYYHSALFGHLEILVSHSQARMHLPKESASCGLVQIQIDDDDETTRQVANCFF